MNKLHSSWSQLRMFSWLNTQIFEVSFPVRLKNLSHLPSSFAFYQQRARWTTNEKSAFKLVLSGLLMSENVLGNWIQNSVFVWFCTHDQTRCSNTMRQMHRALPQIHTHLYRLKRRTKHIMWMSFVWVSVPPGGQCQHQQSKNISSQSYIIFLLRSEIRRSYTAHTPHHT